MRTEERLRVVIDTDPGLDDAVAILHALSEPRFAVEAIAAVAGNIGIETTTANVGRLLAVVGREDVPYAAGAAGPLAGLGRSEVAIHGADGLGGVPLPTALRAPEARGATALLAGRLMAAQPGTVSVLALGPLTNLALLLREAPDAYRRLGRIIAMGGTIHETGNAGAHAEFNLAADPLAAQEVLASGLPVTLVPLDVTRKLRATPADLDRLAASGTAPATLAAGLIRAYFADHADRSSRPLHDPCVMLMALEPKLFGTEEMRVAIDRDAEPGRVLQVPDGARIDVATSIDAAAAMALLWRGLGAAR